MTSLFQFSWTSHPRMKWKKPTSHRKALNSPSPDHCQPARVSSRDLPFSFKGLASSSRPISAPASLVNSKCEQKSQHIHIGTRKYSHPHTQSGHTHTHAHTHTHTHTHTCKCRQMRTPIFDPLNEDTCVQTYYRQLWDTLCVKLRTHNLCMTFQRWTEDSNPVHVNFSIFQHTPICKSRQFAKFCLHISTNCGPSSFAMLFSVWWWSVGVMSSVDSAYKLTHTHTHTRIYIDLWGYTIVLSYSSMYPTRQISFVLSNTCTQQVWNIAIYCAYIVLCFLQGSIC